MPAQFSRTPTVTQQHARAAVAALFLTNGALIANLLPRYPEIKSALALGNTTYGLTIAALPTGAIAAGLFAAALIRRFGSAPVAVIGTVGTSIAILLAGISPSAGLFAVGLFLAGALDAITDVAQNAHALRVQREYRRSILNSFHAVWSIGAVLGGSMAAAAIALNVPLGWHLGVSALVFAIVALVALRFCLPGPDQVAQQPDGPGQGTSAAAARGGGPSRTPVSGRTVLMLLAFVLVAISGALVEDAGNSWAALYLSADLGAPAALAATGYIALVGAQTVGRLLGDRLVDRYGQRAVARAGGVIVTVGMGTALALPTVPGTIAGFALAGFGVATLVPAAMSEANDLPGLRPGTGLTVVSWLMRLGFLASPPVVGLVADATSLRVGLLVVPLAGVLVVLLAGVLSGRRRRTITAPG